MAEKLREVDAAALKAAMDRGQVRLIDVREADEHARERIPGATLMPLSQLDPAKIALAPGEYLVLHCVTGRRSAQAAERLREAGIAELSHLGGGIAAWKQAGYDVTRDRRAPLPIMRQVLLIAGTMALLGVVLGFAVHPGFFLLSGMVGAGLAFAGLTGNCMMSVLLEKLPYNRPRQA